jgi:transcriptional regulator with XRE-family HTH domain
MKTQLQRIRIDRGFKSAKAFAEHIGVSVRTYTNHEQGIASPPLDIAWLYADALGVTLDELAGRDFQPKEYTDDRQAQLNDDFETLDDASKTAAAAAVRGIAAACARGEAQTQGHNDNTRRVSA